jgi:hypothetical protein
MILRAQFRECRVFAFEVLYILLTMLMYMYYWQLKEMAGRNLLDRVALTKSMRCCSGVDKIRAAKSEPEFSPWKF